MDAVAEEHHDVFRHFAPWSGYAPKGFVVDFLGVRTRKTLIWQKDVRDLVRLAFGWAPQEIADKIGDTTAKMPRFNEEYFEWIALLEAVVEAQGRFTMLELGAGWGRWLVRAAAAARRRRLRSRLVAVEADATHFRWMKQHLKDNGVSRWRAKLVEAAMSSENGVAWFLTGDPFPCFGQRIVTPEEVTAGVQARQVRAVSLAFLLRSLDRVDLVDLDIQGAEAEVLAPARDALARGVRHVHIGTHNSAVEAELRHLFGDVLGWRCLNDYPCGSTSKTAYGTITFEDGVQDWRNPTWSPSR